MPAQAPAARYPTPDEQHLLSQLDAVRQQLQALGADVGALPGIDSQAVARLLRGAQRHLVDLAQLVADLPRRRGA